MVHAPLPPQSAVIHSISEFVPLPKGQLMTRLIPQLCASRGTWQSFCHGFCGLPFQSHLQAGREVLPSGGMAGSAHTQASPDPVVSSVCCVALIQVILGFFCKYY